MPRAPRPAGRLAIRRHVAGPRGLQRELTEIFGIDRFKPGQEAVIRAVLRGRHTLAILPTGGGKSLCYQLPALRLPGLTLVVSPLISLMKDQAEKLDDLGLEAAYVNSALNAAELAAALDAIESSRAKFVLITPERLADAEFQQTLSRRRVDFIVIDEAHCISTWGHDFRPAYLALGTAIARFPRATVLALTATATAEVVEDIRTQLALPEMHVIATGLYRPNLTYEVQPAEREADQQRALVELIAGATGVGIVYCATVRAVESVTDLLTSAGVDVAKYHGRMRAAERHAAQDRFMRGELRAIVATNAFGLGIDKPDIRFVVHYNMPGSLDAYYQEAGRAGRDGEASRCVLLYEKGDRRTHAFFMAGKYPTFDHLRTLHEALRRAGAHESPMALHDIQAAADVPKTKVHAGLPVMKQFGIVRELRGARFRLASPSAGAEAFEEMARRYADRLERDRSRLDRMVAYAQTARCRWIALLEAFDEASEVGDGCGHCDNCRKEQLRRAS